MEQRVKCLLSGCAHNDCNLLWSCYQFLVNLITLSKHLKSWNLVRTGQYSLGTTSRHVTLKIKGQGHGWGNNSKSQCGSNILSTHIPFVPCQSTLPFLSYDFFKIWPWNSKVKVMGEVTVQSHNVGLTSYRLTSLLFHVNWPSHSWNTASSKFDLEN